MKECKYYIYMIELKRLDNSSNLSHFYVGKTDNLESRLLTHIFPNRKTTELIKHKGIQRAKVIAISEIYEIVFDGEKIKTLESITSLIENKFVYDKINSKETDIEQNKQIYRGGHYTHDWNESKSYEFKNINKIRELEKNGFYKLEPVLDEKYPIRDYSADQIKEYKLEIKAYIKEKVRVCRKG